MNISFTKKQQDYITEQVTSGDFQNASEVVRDALRLHEIYRVRLLNELKAEIDKGWSAPTSSRNIKDIIQEKKEKS